jgi:endonuclease/exonuclease/phosphatase (EEP) superfamily protein YafD
MDLPRWLTMTRRGGGSGGSGGGRGGRGAAPSTVRRGAATVRVAVVWVLVVAAIAGLAARTITFHQSVLLGVAAFSPFLMAGGPIALIIQVIFRRRMGAGVAAIVTVICVITQAPLFVAAHAPANSDRLVMMTANLRLGSADPQALVRLVRQHGVDVLTTQELTGSEARRLDAAGLAQLLPYSALDARVGAEGVGIWSRYPLSSEQQPAGFMFAIVAARLAVPGVAIEPTVLATHMPGPWPQNAAAWSHDITALPATLVSLASGNPSGALLVGGDFNSTPDTAQFRKLLGDGYRDAAEQAGAGYTPTYPGDTWFGPLIGIDHVLTRNAVATSADSLTIPGSDHRALLVRIAIPRA